MSEDLQIQKRLENIVWGDVGGGVRFGSDIWNKEC